MSKYVFSTLANDQLYRNYANNAQQGVSIVESEVLIRGGAGVANDRLITPLGVATEISDAQLALLEANAVFQLHKKNGHIVIRDKRADADKVATDMNARDPSKPLTPADYLSKEVDAVKSGNREVVKETA